MRTVPVRSALAAVAALLLATAGPGAASSAGAVPGEPSTLGSGQRLTAGTTDDHLTSPSGEFALDVESALVSVDQTVRLADGDTYGTGTWFRNDVTGRYAPQHDRSVLLLKGDGNLVLRLADGTRLWASGTAGSGAKRLRLTDGGNLLLQNTAGKVVWSSGSGRVVLTAGSTLRPGHRLLDAWNTALGSRYHRQSLTMGKDGNLVYRCGAKVLWQTRTHTPGSALVVTPHDSLLVRGPKGKTLWSSRTGRHTASTVLTVRGLELKQVAPSWRTLWSHPQLSCD